MLQLRISSSISGQTSAWYLLYASSLSGLRRGVERGGVGHLGVGEQREVPAVLLAGPFHRPGLVPAHVAHENPDLSELPHQLVDQLPGPCPIESIRRPLLPGPEARAEARPSFASAARAFEKEKMRERRVLCTSCYPVAIADIADIVDIVDIIDIVD